MDRCEECGRLLHPQKQDRLGDAAGQPHDNNVVCSSCSARAAKAFWEWHNWETAKPIRA